MKSEKFIKWVTIILFFIIIIPNEKFIMPNFLYLILQAISIFDVSFLNVKNLFFLFLGICSIILIYKKDKKINLIGYIISILYFLPNFQNNVNVEIYLYFLFSFTFYLVSIFFRYNFDKKN